MGRWCASLFHLPLVASTNPSLRFACQGTVGPRTSDSFNKTSHCFANRRSANQPVFLKQSENLAHEPYDKPGIRLFF